MTSKIHKSSKTIIPVSKQITLLFTLILLAVFTVNATASHTSESITATNYVKGYGNSFIFIEGGIGSGKSTLVKELQTYCTNNNLKMVLKSYKRPRMKMMKKRRLQKISNSKNQSKQNNQSAREHSYIIR